jgi:hypothetical protein
MTTEIGAPAAPAAPTPGAPAAPAAPAAAPVAAAPAPDSLTIGEPEPKAEPTPSAEAVVEYEPTGDPGLDLALDFLGSLGLGPEDPAMKAAIDGKFDLLEGKLSGMGDKAKGYNKYLALAKKAHAEQSTKAAEKASKDAATIHAAVGGKEQWAAISKWAGDNAEPEERAQVNAALKQGGMVAKAMAVHLATLYGKAKGTTVEPAEAVKADAGGKPASAGPLDAKQYGKEVVALRGKLGYKMEASSEYKQLQQRRLAGKARGL